MDWTRHDRRAKNQLLPFASYDSEDETRDSTTKRCCGRMRMLMAVFNDDYFEIDLLPFNGIVAEKLNCTNWNTRPSQAMWNSCVPIRQQWAKQNAEIRINCTTEPHTKWNFLFCLVVLHDVFVVIKDLEFDLEPFGIGWMLYGLKRSNTRSKMFPTFQLFEEKLLTSMEEEKKIQTKVCSYTHKHTSVR